MAEGTSSRDVSGERLPTSNPDAQALKFLNQMAKNQTHSVLHALKERAIPVHFRNVKLADDNTERCAIIPLSALVEGEWNHLNKEQ